MSVSMRVTKRTLIDEQIFNYDCKMGHAEDRLDEFTCFKEALAAGWRRKDRKFLCPACAKEMGVE